MGRSKVEQRAAQKARKRAARAEGKDTNGGSGDGKGSSRASAERLEDRRNEGLAEQQERLKMEKEDNGILQYLARKESMVNVDLGARKKVSMYQSN